MTLKTTSRVGKLTVNNVPEKYECSQIIKDLLEDLPGILQIQIPSDANAGFVIASQNAPDNGEAVLWVELSGSGVPISISYFQDGAWRKILNILRNPQWHSDDYLSNKDRLNSQGLYLMDGFAGTPDLRPLFVKSAESPVNYSLYAVAYVGRQSIENV